LSEARTGKRFPLRLPITVRDAGESIHTGVTGNVSAAGVFLQVPAELELGAEVEFDISLPAAVLGGETDVAVHCKGRVVRLEQESGSDGSQNGVGCVIDQYSFVRKDEKC